MCFLLLLPLGDPQYMSSLSHLADSSLSEEMSQFDFSTGVQSYSYGSQDPKSTAGHLQKQVTLKGGSGQWGQPLLLGCMSDPASAGGAWVHVTWTDVGIPGMSGASLRAGDEGGH